MRRRGTVPVTWVLAAVCCAATALGAQEVLLSDDFARNGPLDVGKTWTMIDKKVAPPRCEGGTVFLQPTRNFHSQKVFSEPISVRFDKVFMTQSATTSANNNIGITPGYSTNMICFRFSLGNIYAVRRHEGTVYGEPDKISPGEWGTLVGEITPRGKDTQISIPYDLRIDWWPGKLVRYYVDGRRVAEHFDHVMDTPSPIGVRDESAHLRIGGVKVTRPAESADDLLAARARARQAAADAEQASSKAAQAKLQARLDDRIKGVAAQFRKELRMVIGGPCYFWGMDPVIERDLKAAGMEVLVWPEAPLLDPEGSHLMARDPMDYNIILFGDSFYHLIQPDPNTGEIPKKITDQIPKLRRFLAAGGGLWFCGLGEQNWGRSSHALNRILKDLELDAEVLGEVVKDSEAIKGPGSHFPYYAWADVTPDPLTQGVSNLLHPSGVISGEASMGVSPILRLGPEWRVLLKGKRSAASYQAVEGRAEGKLKESVGTVKSSPILCAVRETGKGRVVLWPTWTNFTVTGGSGGMVVDGEHGGRWSDGARLIENLLCWLAEPSQGSKAVGTFEPKAYKRPDDAVDVEGKLKAWARPGRRDYPRQFKGLIGAHSSLSDGTSTPEEMIAAAKRAGYDFIAFTEDLAGMNAAKWNTLLSACDTANKADPKFIAYAGFDFLDEAGNRGLHFGNRYWVKDEWRSKEDPSRIRWWYSLAYQADANAKRWSPRVIVRSRTNNKRPWNQGLWSLFSAYCYEAGKLVDDSFHEWRRLIGPHVYFLNTGIAATHTVRSSADIVASSRPGLYQTYVRADNLPQVLSRIRGCVAPMGYFPTYISAGPRITDFKCYAAQMGGEISFDLAVPGNERGRLHVLVEADAGLREVAVYDGERLFRRFRPEGKRFETFITISGDSYHCYSMTVTDRQGRKAVSWNAFLQIQERVHRRCGDNWNWMSTGKRAGSAGTPAFPYNLHETTHGWRTKSLEEAAPARQLYWCEQNSYGHGGLSGVVNGYIRGGGLLVGGGPWPKGYPAPAITLNFATIGRYGSILTTTVRDEKLVPKLEPYTIGAFSGPYKVTPSPWPADLKQFVPLSKPDGATINRYQGSVRFLKEVKSPDRATIPIGLGATGKPTARTVEIMSPDGTSIRRQASGEVITGAVPVGGYVCWYDDEGDGVGGMIALSPGLHYSYSTKWQEFYLEAPSPVEAGTEFTWDVIFVSGNRSTTNSNAQMEDVRLGMGIAGKPTLYDVRLRTGKILDQKYFLTLDAERGGCSAKIVKTTKKLLPIHLPAMLHGLNPRWSAVIWYRGLARLHTPDYYRDRWGVKTWRWVIGKYDLRTDEVRPIPVLDGGIGYCQIDTDKQNPDVFIGNPLVCTRPEVFLTLVKAERGQCTFDINNPTDRALRCTVRPAKGFDLVGSFRKVIKLAPGAFKTVTVVGR